ncbi:MAG: D-alanyl-D-alanine carboxypeptidase family protein [Fischerella sp.]|nr:D-alanyl-D-alanine carboxypeptidase family protein [Fischerella sp.]
MNNAEFSRKPRNSSPVSGEDIPAALRDTPDVVHNQRTRLFALAIAGMIGLALLAAIGGILFSLTAPKKNAGSQPSFNHSTSDKAQNNLTDRILGHLSYPEAPESELVAISADGRQRMRKAAAQKFQEMSAAARSAGVILVPVSGFRSIKEQEQLFFSIGAQRNQTPAQRASLSAPPGHSEHHTGYAVDIGDGAAPATNLTENFENTKAFQWLQANAARFSFEMSFPKNNPQGVSYEPWHWRFVGDRDSLETFYRARNIKPIQTPQ